MLNLEIKLEEENHLKDMLSEKRKENMGVSFKILFLKFHIYTLSTVSNVVSHFEYPKNQSKEMLLLIC